MMIRIVKLDFHLDQVDLFREIFATHQSLIRQFPGCLHLELWQEPNPGNIFFTYSHWESPEALELYRRSPLFREIWTTIKVMFHTKPEAWTVKKMVEVQS
jgi:autoinducer 2-degrading protein